MRFLDLVQKGVFTDKIKKVTFENRYKVQTQRINHLSIRKKRKITVRSSFGICYKLDRRCKASLNNTFSLGLDLGTVVIGGESS